MEETRRHKRNSEEYQLLLIEGSFKEVHSQSYKMYKQYLSEDFKSLLENTDSYILASMLQHEFSVQIKGKCDGNIEKYKSIKARDDIFVLLKVGNCHSEDEVRRISISWTTNAKPCDSSLRLERQALCHCEPRSGVAIQYSNHLDCFVVLRTPRNDGKSLLNF